MRRQALTIAQNNLTRYNNIASSTSSIFFMATPHRGSDHAALLGGVAEVANLPLAGTLTSRFAGKFRNDLIRGLEKDSPEILKIAEDFQQLADDGTMKFFSFIEMKKTKPLTRKVSHS